MVPFTKFDDVQDPAVVLTYSTYVPDPKAVVLPTVGKAVPRVKVVGDEKLVDLTTKYPVGGELTAAVKDALMVVYVCDVEEAEAAIDVGAEHVNVVLALDETILHEPPVAVTL